MPHTGPKPPVHSTAPAARKLWLACYAMLGVILAYTLVARYFLPLHWAEPVGIERAGAAASETDGIYADNPLDFDERIDPNVADWPELTRLPGIGEVTAKRIVEYRQEHLQNPDQPVFGCCEDLARVRGIGPKTVEALRPHLRFGDDR
jgi:predicted flap endonuclease-1-like 5' DNA nuclease